MIVLGASVLPLRALQQEQAAVGRAASRVGFRVLPAAPERAGRRYGPVLVPAQTGAEDGQVRAHAHPGMYRVIFIGIFFFYLK